MNWGLIEIELMNQRPELTFKKKDNQFFDKSEIIHDISFGRKLLIIQFTFEQKNRMHEICFQYIPGFSKSEYQADGESAQENKQIPGIKNTDHNPKKQQYLNSKHGCEENK